MPLRPLLPPRRRGRGQSRLPKLGTPRMGRAAAKLKSRQAEDPSMPSPPPPPTHTHTPHPCMRSPTPAHTHTLTCTNTSPGFSPISALAGTRASEHPILQRIAGGIGSGRVMHGQVAHGTGECRLQGWPAASWCWSGGATSCRSPLGLTEAGGAHQSTSISWMPTRSLKYSESLCNVRAAHSLQEEGGRAGGPKGGGSGGGRGWRNRKSPTKLVCPVGACNTRLEAQLSALVGGEACSKARPQVRGWARARATVAGAAHCAR